MLSSYFTLTLFLALSGNTGIENKPICIINGQKYKAKKYYQFGLKVCIPTKCERQKQSPFHGYLWNAFKLKENGHVLLLLSPSHGNGVINQSQRCL